MTFPKLPWSQCSWAMTKDLASWQNEIKPCAGWERRNTESLAALGSVASLHDIDRPLGFPASHAHRLPFALRWPGHLTPGIFQQTCRPDGLKHFSSPRIMILHRCALHTFFCAPPPSLRGCSITYDVYPMDSPGQQSKTTNVSSVGDVFHRSFAVAVRSFSMSRLGSARQHSATIST
jgi:hypothetical protein